MKIEIRSDSVNLSGYVNAVERRSAVLPQSVCRTAPGDFAEVIRSGTFAESLRRNAHVDLRFNHERTIDTAVELREDNIGLHAEATISDMEIVNAARGGKLTGWSFGFTNPKEEWSEPDDKGDGNATEYEYRQNEEENTVEDKTVINTNTIRQAELDLIKLRGVKTYDKA